MHWGNVFVFIIGSALVLKRIESKKYDVEAEALKLYGEDINDVVAKFRRTPDYLKILDSKIESLWIHFSDMILQTQFYYDEKLKDKVGDLIGVQQSDFEEISQEPLKGNEPITIKTFYRNGVRFRRQGSGRKEGSKESNSSQEVTSKEHKLRVQKLDSYHKLSSTLTLAQRNSLKDLGFEFAGHIIHSLIRSMGGNDIEEKSTRLPYGGETPDSKYSSTTPHAIVHEVTPASVLNLDLASTLQSDITHLDNPFFRYEKKTK